MRIDFTIVSLLDGEDEVDTQPTLGFQRVIQRAMLHVQSSGKKEVNGANVLVAIPHVNRGKGDPRNLMAVVTGKEEHGYQLGIKKRILRGLYTRNQFELSDSYFIAIQSVNYGHEISFSKAVSNVSLCEGQGYTKCGCSASGTTRCHTKPKRCL